jgi:type 1 glutamine amidotransferase
MLSAKGPSSSKWWGRMLAVAALMVLLGAAQARADTGRVLVFHPDPAGHPEVSAGIGAMRDLGRRGDFQVDATSNTTAFTGSNLAPYRAVVFLNAAGNRLNGEQEGALADYMQRGGGFVGIGTAAEAEPGTTLLDDLIGARPDPASPTGSATQTVAVGDRVHPATRDLPLELNRTDVWYRWQTRPTGMVHTVARWHALSAPAGDGTTVGGTDHPISWCRDVRGGRSFYTGMGRTAGSSSVEPSRGHWLGAIEWAAGLVRGNC